MLIYRKFFMILRQAVILELLTFGIYHEWTVYNPKITEFIRYFVVICDFPFAVENQN